MKYIAQFLLPCIIASPALGSDFDWYPSLSIEGGVPFGGGLSLETVLGHRRELDGSKISGVLLRCMPGICGGKVDVGYGYRDELISGIDISLSFYQQWRDLGSIQAGSRYLGACVGGIMLLFYGQAGVYAKLDGRGSPGSMGFFGAGIGF